MIVAAGQIIATAASAFALVCVVLFIGTVLLALARSLVSSIEFSVGLAFAAGLLGLSLTSWYLFLLATPLRHGFAGLLAATIGAALIATASPAGRRLLAGVLPGIRSAWPVALILLFHCCVMSALVLLPLGRDDLPLVTIGNNDIHSYVRMAGYLLDDAADIGNVLQYDMRAKAGIDVFGAYMLLAFAAFLRAADPVYVAEVPLVAVTALIGTFAACLCRRLWRLPRVLSALVGATVLTNGLFAFATLHYYLSQLACAALLLIFTHYFLAMAGRRHVDFATVVVGETVLLGCVLFVYSALLFPIIVACALLASWLMLVQAADERPGPMSLDAALAALRVAVCGGLLAIGLVCLAAPTRVARTFGRLAYYSQKDIVGWPLGFIHPAALLGLPTFAEPAFDASAGVVAEVAEAGAVLALVIWLMVLVFRRGPTRAESLLGLTPLLAFFGLLLAYFGVWRLYGPSYQQWKFAISFPLLLSFSAAGSLCYLVYRPESRRRSGLALSLAALLVIAAGWMSIGRTLYPKAMHFPRAIGAIAAIDGMPGIDRVYVDFPNSSWGDRMLAANFVKRPQLAFLQPTYYDHLQTNVHATRTEPILRQAVPACTAPDEFRLGGGYHLATSDRRPALVPGVPVAFDRPLGSCIGATGLSAPEPGGAWTDGRSVELSFACDCAKRDEGLTVTLIARAFIVPGVPQQRMLVRLDGAPLGEWAVSDAAEHRFAIPLPRGLGPAVTVRLALSFPDATSPASLGLSGDRRLLGFQLVSFALADVGR